MKGLLVAASLVVAVAKTCDPSTFEKNIAYSAGSKSVIATTAASDASSCCGLCANNAKCKSWTFMEDTLKCKLRSSKPGDGRKSETNRISGPGNGTPVPPGPPPTPPPAPPVPPTPPVPPPHGKPNFLFVLTDDQDALLNGYSPTVGIAHMKQLNTRVRAEGALFTAYYDAYALCSPSRSTILTGRFPHNHGFTTNSMLFSSHFHPVQEQDTVNVWLNRTGYHTMLVGKYMNGYHGSEITSEGVEVYNGNGGYQTYIPPGWGDWYGFQSLPFFGPRVNTNGKSIVYPKDAYQTDVIANISLNWLRNDWQKDRPFFMMITPHAPHNPHTPAPRHKGTLSGLVQSPDPAFNEPDNLQKTLPKGLNNLKTVSKSKMDKTFEARAECLLAIDEMIGNLLDELEHQGVLQNTYIIYASDNGYHLGQQRLPGGKRLFFEHDINLPLIISGPGVAKKSTITEMVSNVDLTPTWAELAGASPTEKAPTVDGISFASLLKGSNAAWPRTFTVTEGFQDAEGGVKCCGKYHGIRIHNDEENSLYVETGAGEPAYFDSAKDPSQTTNVYNSLSSDKKSKLADQLNAVKACVGKTCPGREPEQGMDFELV